MIQGDLRNLIDLTIGKRRKEVKFFRKKGKFGSCSENPTTAACRAVAMLPSLLAANVAAICTIAAVAGSVKHCLLCIDASIAAVLTATTMASRMQQRQQEKLSSQCHIHAPKPPKYLNNNRVTKTHFQSIKTFKETQEHDWVMNS